MKNLTILSVLFLLIFAVKTDAFGQDDSVSAKPNIVLILVDDSGLMDFGAYGGEARTQYRQTGQRRFYVYEHACLTRLCTFQGHDLRLANICTEH